MLNEPGSSSFAPASHRFALGTRIVAGLIDWLLASAITSTLFFVLATRATVGSVAAKSALVELSFGQTERYLSGAGAVGYSLASLLVWLGVFALIPFWRGATPGMMVFRLHVIGADGGPVSLLRHLLRTLLWIADGFPYFIPGMIGLLSIVATPTRQRIGDVAARTLVVNVEY